MKKKIFSIIALSVIEIVIIASTCALSFHIYDMCINDIFNTWMDYIPVTMLSLLWIAGIIDTIVLPNAIKNVLSD